ncbi:unnamed protein product [[Candida] boidinii]|uniref:Unnamed protein product n=1 Tax=Candida boidinii TaxID=5477 RepID=A0ACB5TWF7_CANBO|nr:unnamed protein product [[Candida] boidinii]
MGVLLEKDTLVNELVNSLVERKAGDGYGENEGDGELVLNKESSLTLSLLFPQVYIEAMNLVDGFLVLPSSDSDGIDNNDNGYTNDIDDIDIDTGIDKDNGSEAANQEQRCGGDRPYQGNQGNQLRLVRFSTLELCILAGGNPRSGKPGSPETTGERTSPQTGITSRSIVCDMGEWFCSCDIFAAGCWDPAPAGRTYCPHLLSLLILQSHRDKLAVRTETLGGGGSGGGLSAVGQSSGKQALISQISETNAHVGGWLACNASLWPGKLTLNKPTATANVTAAEQESTAEAQPEKIT